MYSPTLQNLIEQFTKFPTVGPRTAARFVFYLIENSHEEIDKLVMALGELKAKIKLCQLCGKSFEGQEKLCSICSDKRRDKNLLCLAEKEIDLEAIEKTNSFKGLYFILGAVLNNNELTKEKLDKRISQLLERIKKDHIKEVILALNPTVEGQQTALLVKRRLEAGGLKKITQLARGLPVGGELEYADEETLTSAFNNRH